MTRTKRLLIFAFIFFFIGITTGQNKQPSVNKPNVLFVMADDLGYNHLGVYGQKKIKTPHIDKLASQGMRFTQFYAGANVCGPSRTSLMLGLHAGHVPYRDNGDYHLADSYGPIGNLKTIGELFKEEGYATGYFGKYGLGGKEGVENGQKPNDRGFDEFWGLLEHGHGHFHFSSYIWHNKEKYSLKNKTRTSKGRPFGLSSLNVEDRKEHTDDVFASKAVEFIEEQAKSDKPFFCFLSFSVPHTEMLPNERFAKEYRKLGWEEYNSKNNGYHVSVDTPRANFAGMVSQVDSWTGQVLKTLEDMGIADNTLVVFTSDNGGQLRETWGDAPSIFFEANGVLRKGKEWNYEGGIRVPLIMKWPNKIKENTVNEHVGYFPDFMPTFTDVIDGGEIKKTDGVSFVPTLLGENEKQIEHAYLYWERPLYVKEKNIKKIHPTKLRQAVRFDNWKAIREDKTEAIELYNLENDIGENKNVAAVYPIVIKKALRLFEEAHLVPLDLPKEPNVND